MEGGDTVGVRGGRCERGKQQVRYSLPPPLTSTEVYHLPRLTRP